jgi:hypothetical protein
VVSQRNTLVLAQKLEISAIDTTESYLGLIIFAVIFVLSLTCRITNEIREKGKGIKESLINDHSVIA